MKKRHKPNIPLLTQEEVDDHLRQLGVLEADLDIVRANAEKELSKVRERFGRQEYPLTQQIESVKEKITHYLEYHRADFQDKRSRELKHGSIGWRKIRSDKLRVIQKKALASLKNLGLSNFIRIKEEVNKDALADHIKKHPEFLDRIDGVTKPEEKEECWFEARREPEPANS